MNLIYHSSKNINGEKKSRKSANLFNKKLLACFNCVRKSNSFNDHSVQEVHIICTIDTKHYWEREKEAWRSNEDNNIHKSAPVSSILLYLLLTKKEVIIIIMKQRRKEEVKKDFHSLLSPAFCRLKCASFYNRLLRYWLKIHCYIFVLNFFLL